MKHRCKDCGALMSRAEPVGWDGKRFIAPELGAYLLSTETIAVREMWSRRGPDWRLVVQVDGAWLDGPKEGEHYIQRRISELLKDRWKSSYASATVKWLLSAAPPFEDEEAEDWDDDEEAS